MRVRYSIHHASEPLVVQRGTTASNTYHYYTSIDKLRHQSLYTSSCRQTELKTMLSSYNESKTTVKENILQNFCYKEWKLLPIKVGLSPFLLMDCISFCITTVVQPPPCTVIFKISRLNRMMAAILNLLMRSDQEDGYLKNVHSLANGQTVTKYSAI